MDNQDIEFGHDEHAAFEDAAPSFREKPDGTVDPAGEAGWFLQREREKRGESLEYAGEETGIHPYHIEAIEFGDMTRMPTRMEALEMISAYAQYLGFDPEPLVRHYLQFLPKPAVAPRASHPANPAPLSSAKILAFGKMPKLPQLNINFKNIPGGAGGLVASVAAAVILFAGASWMMIPGGDTAAPVAQVAPAADPMPTASTGSDAAAVTVTDDKMPDDQVASATGTEQPVPEGVGNDPTAENSTVPADQVVDLPDGDVDGLGAFIAEKIPENGKPVKPEQVATAGEQASAIPAPADATSDDVLQTPDGKVYGAKNENARLILKAKAPVWVRVEDAQGNVVLTQMLMRGDSYKVPDREGLVVIARDGGLLSYMIDGKEKGILGTPGEILVGRSLDIKSFEG
jgi:cytoskeleton protein RodZ